jgi:hypothetical protein
MEGKPAATSSRVQEIDEHLSCFSDYNGTGASLKHRSPFQNQVDYNSPIVVVCTKGPF